MFRFDRRLFFDVILINKLLWNAITHPVNTAAGGSTATRVRSCVTLATNCTLAKISSGAIGVPVQIQPLWSAYLSAARWHGICIATFHRRNTNHAVISAMDVRTRLAVGCRTEAEHGALGTRAILTLPSRRRALRATATICTDFFARATVVDAKAACSKRESVVFHNTLVSVFLGDIASVGRRVIGGERGTKKGGILVEDF